MRIRTIKPEFFTHESLYDLEVSTGLPIRVSFIGLWCAADKEGRFKWEPRRLGVSILPYDLLDFSRVLDALTTRGFIVRYASEKGEFGVIPSFHRHQVINNRERDSELPEPPPMADPDACPTRAPRVPHASKEEGKGREGEGEGKEGTHCASGDARPAPLPASPPSSDPHPFDSFWSAYPVKKRKGAARRSWDRQKLGPKLPQILATIDRLRRSDDAWQRGYIPHPATWLNAAGWEDEANAPPIFSPQKKGPAGFHRETASAIDLPTLCDPHMPEPPFDWRAMLPVLYDAATTEDIADLSKTPWGLVPIEIRNELTRHHQHTNLKSA